MRRRRRPVADPLLLGLAALAGPLITPSARDRGVGLDRVRAPRAGRGALGLREWGFPYLVETDRGWRAFS